MDNAEAFLDRSAAMTVAGIGLVANRLVPTAAAWEAPLQVHGYEKYPASQTLMTSRDLGWSNISAELRSHPRGIIASCSARCTELMLLLRGRSRITRETDGVRQTSEATPGMLWLSPAGAREDLIEISNPLPEALHVFLPETLFSPRALGGDGYSGDIDRLRYEGGFRDLLLEPILRSLLVEMRAPTRYGALLADGLACTLAARLIHKYAGINFDALPAPSRGGGLDPRRLRRVCEFIEANLGRELHLDQLAQVACLSQYHFARAFKKATGDTVHQYLTTMRLERAKELLAANEASIADIAFQCSFSSQANFTKAFVRSLGISPGRYRRACALPVFPQPSMQYSFLMEARFHGCANGEQRKAPADNLITHVSPHHHYRGGQIRLESSKPVHLTAK
jgi:AraC family transcriptional regulator